MPSARKQKSTEKRSRQSDVMSDIENLDVTLGSYQRDNSEFQEGIRGNNIDLRSNRQEGELNQNDSEFGSYLNTNLSEICGLTVQTSRALSSEISSQMSKKLEEMKTDTNTGISDAINTAFEGRVLTSMKNAVGGQTSAKNTTLDLPSDGPYPSNFSQVHTQRNSSGF